MSIKIHHGSPGSYKTSGAIQDDVMPALRSGRLIITNVRGFTRERIFSLYPDMPSSLEVIHLSIEDPDDMEKMRNWFTWAPRGAFIVFDETQLVFLKSWREKDLQQFDFPGGSSAAKEADRPMGWLDAWTRHRHWNWDVILTTPNIKFVRDDIRDTADRAYMHANLALLGIGGRYKEASHHPADNRPPLNGTVMEFKKIKKETFKLYDSTATGIVSDTIAGKSIFRSPKLLCLLALITGCFGYLIATGGPSFFSSKPPASVSPVVIQDIPQPAPSRPQISGDQAGRVLPAALPVQPSHPVDSLGHPFQDHHFSILGSIYSAQTGEYRYIFQLISPHGSIFQVPDRVLGQSGYRVSSPAECSVKVVHGSWSTYAVCSPGGGGAQRPAQQRSDSAARI